MNASDVSYAQEAEYWYQQGNAYGQNQCDLILQQGGPDGIVELAVPLQWDSAYSRGMSAGYNAETP